MKCLNCGTELTNNEVVTKKNRISYDMCEQCGSLWLDAGELDKMAFQVPGSIEFCEATKPGLAERQPKQCPRCDDFVLDRIKFLESDIYLHHCRNCGGFWLDGRELELIDKELADFMPVRGNGFSDFVTDVHVPYWYKRVKKATSETDFHIEVPPIKGAIRGADTSDRCPACGATLALYSAYSMHFEGCPRCKGMWLIKDELRELKNKVNDGALRWLNDEIENVDQASAVASKRACVTCGTGMVSVIFGKSSVLVDWCPRCHGMWLDRGEFETITDYLKHELIQMHPKTIEEHIATDVHRIWSGGPERRLDEVLDAKAAVSALVNATIFEHPRLFSLLVSVPTAQSLGFP